MKSSNRRRQPSFAVLDADFSRAAIDQLAITVGTEFPERALVSATAILDGVVEARRNRRNVTRHDPQIDQLTAAFYQFARLLDAAESAGYVSSVEWSQIGMERVC